MSYIAKVGVIIDVFFIVVFPTALIVDWMFDNHAPAWLAAITGAIWWAALNRLERGIKRRALGTAAETK